MSHRGKRERARDRNRRRALARATRRPASPERALPGVGEPVLGAEPPTIRPSLEWYAIRVKPRMGDSVRDDLGKLSVPMVVPRVTEIALREGRRVIRSRQLLLRTVFIGVEDRAQLDEVAGQRGIAGIVSEPREEASEGNVEALVMRPARLDPVALQGFVNALARNEIVQPFGVKVGGQVVVRDGPFASFPAVVQEILPGERIKVGVAIFGRSSPCVLGIAQVQIVN